MMATHPWKWDLVGLYWDEAEKILSARGQSYQISITSPPTRTEGVGPLRVVAHREQPEGLWLVLAYREYQRPLTEKGGSDPSESVRRAQGGFQGAC